MLLSASPEFVEVCQAQVALLSQSLGASLSIVYLTEELTEVANAKLVPIVAYPEEVKGWGEEQILALLLHGRNKDRTKPALMTSDKPANPRRGTVAVLPQDSVLPSDAAVPEPSQAAEQALVRQQQLITPLIHEDMVMGLLITARADRDWTEQEQGQIKKIAETLAIACILDQRSQWLAQDIQYRDALQGVKRDNFDNLIHQFRNPLTALRTFGKLLIKRLQPGEANRDVAESIVRESDRLQELLKQLDAAIDEAPRRLPAADAASGATSGATSGAATVPTVPLLPGTNVLTGAPLKLERQPIRAVLAPLLVSAEAIAQDRNLTLNVNLCDSLPPAQMDVQALGEVLSNLIDNALKYTPAGGSIWVQTQTEPMSDRESMSINQQLSVQAKAEGKRSRQMIAIWDSGPGIPATDLAHLFERHYRGVQAQTEIPGTGLGLAIARDLVIQMQGDIHVFSPAATCLSHLLKVESEMMTRSVQTQLFNFPSPGTAVVIWLHP
jgi:signal transduction histidine kinase